MVNTFSTSSSSKKKTSRVTVEKCAMRVLLVMAWTWIAGLVLVVLWQFRKTESTAHQIKQQRFHLLPGGQQQNDNVKRLTNDPYESPLLIFTCSRADYLSDTLQDIHKYISRPCQFGCPIVISQDGTDKKVEQVIRDYQQKFHDIGIPLVHLHHKQPDVPILERDWSYAYKALALHYGWALDQVFRTNQHSIRSKKHKDTAASSDLFRQFPIPKRVIILEEDIHIAPDFFDYFQATSKLLDTDSTLFAVSAFNDNGHLVSDSKRLLRSDFFPGLGWMMTQNLWMNELQSKWPSQYWDDWLREPAQRHDRQVIRPEVSRTYHFGNKGGASNNQFGNILESVKLNDQHINWKSEDLSYLQNDVFNNDYAKLLKNSRVVKSLDDALKAVKSGPVRLEYRNLIDFKRLAHKLNIMDDEKAKILRTAYKGVVEVRPNNGHQLFLTPKMNKLRQDFPLLN